jgi:hypothetical protein
MSKARPPWQNLYDRIRVRRDGGSVYDLATDTNLDGLEKELGTRLPESYRARMKCFGPGELMRWARLEPVVARPRSPHDAVAPRTRAMRKFQTDSDGEDGPDSKAWLGRLVYFASSGGGDHYAWDPSAPTTKKPYEYRFYYMPHGYEDRPEPAGDSFWRFIEWAEADINSWRELKEREDDEEEEPGLVFDPSRLRVKKKPSRRDVKPWLAWNDGTIRRLALTLQADPRPDEFPVLADALRDAGCDHADLLDSCRPDAHDEDRLWVLNTLLGK